MLQTVARFSVGTSKDYRNSEYSSYFYVIYQSSCILIHNESNKDLSLQDNPISQTIIFCSGNI